MTLAKDESPARVHGTAAVRVTLELSFGQGWDGKCSLEQIRASATRDAREIATKMAGVMRDGRATVVSVDPDVTIRLAVLP